MITVYDAGGSCVAKIFKHHRDFPVMLQDNCKQIKFTNGKRGYEVEVGFKFGDGYHLEFFFNPGYMISIE